MKAIRKAYKRSKIKQGILPKRPRRNRHLPGPTNHFVLSLKLSISCKRMRIYARLRSRVEHEQRVSPPFSVKPSALLRSTPRRVTNDCVVQRCCSALSTFILRETGSVDSIYRMRGGGPPPAAILLKRNRYIQCRRGFANGCSTHANSQRAKITRLRRNLTRVRDARSNHGGCYGLCVLIPKVAIICILTVDHKYVEHKRQSLSDVQRCAFSLETGSAKGLKNNHVVDGHTS